MFIKKPDVIRNPPEFFQNSGWKKADDRGILFSSSIVTLYKNDIIMRRDKYFTIGKASKKCAI